MKRCNHNFKTTNRSTTDPNCGRVCKYCGKHVNQIRKEDDRKEEKVSGSAGSKE